MVAKLGIAAIFVVLALVMLVVNTVQQAQQTACAPAGVPGGGADEPDLEALQVAVRVFEVGREMHVPIKHAMAAFATVIVEAGGNTTMRNPMCYQPGECDRDSVGAFQQRNFSPWTDNGRNRRNVRDAARTFYEQARLKDNPELSAGQLAQAVQVSAFPLKYDLVMPVASAFLARVLALSPVEFAKLAGGGARFTKLAIAPAEGGQRSSATMIWPTVKAPVTSGFGMRWGKLHAGIDIGAGAGSPIYAAAAGVVSQNLSTLWSGGYGNKICLRHAAVTTCYGHMLRKSPYATGVAVRQGEVIGQVGNTGFSFGAHLHFEIREGPDPNSKPKDPLPIMQGAPVSTTTISTSGCGATGRLRALSGSGSGPLAWPLAAPGEVIGRPNQPGSTHDPATWPPGWQSDNALDVAVPVGTPVLAAADGTVCRACGFGALNSSHPQLAGERLTLDAAGTQIYYGHLSRILVEPGQAVRRGQVIGYSGTANGVAHLHVAVRDGDPEQLFGQPPAAGEPEAA